MKYLTLAHGFIKLICKNVLSSWLLCLSSFLLAYNHPYFRLLEQEVVSGRASSSVGSGIALLLEEWGCSGVQRPTLADLIALLDRCNLRVPTAFLRTELLGGSYVTQTALAAEIQLPSGSVIAGSFLVPFWDVLGKRQWEKVCHNCGSCVGTC